MRARRLRGIRRGEGKRGYRRGAIPKRCMHVGTHDRHTQHTHKTHAHTHAHSHSARAHAQTHACTRALSLSLSLLHTHTHTHSARAQTQDARQTRGSAAADASSIAPVRNLELHFDVALRLIRHINQSAIHEPDRWVRERLRTELVENLLFHGVFKGAEALDRVAAVLCVVVVGGGGVVGARGRVCHNPQDVRKS